MKEIVVKVPDNEYSFVMELLKKFPFISFSEEKIADNELNVPETHKLAVRERVAKYKSNPNDVIGWDEMEKTLPLD